MIAKNYTRSDIVGALAKPTFAAIAARQTGSLLRRLVSGRLEDAGIHVVLVTANGIGGSVPYPGAEIVWQARSGGEFQRLLVSWLTDGVPIEKTRPSGSVHVVADCRQCGQRNQVTTGAATCLNGISCSQCGSSFLDMQESTSH